MAKKPRTTAKAKSPETKVADPGARVGTYFTSLTVENIRSFSEPQTLDLTKDGRPARWTVILGENNLGKSTLLEVLTKGAEWLLGLDEPLRLWGRPERYISATLYELSRNNSSDSKACLFGCKFSLGDMRPIDVNNLKFSINMYRANIPIQFPENLTGNDLCFSIYKHDSCAADDESPIKKLMDWLIQADYQAISNNSLEFKNYRDKLHEALIKILPDVSSLRIAQPVRPGGTWPVVQALMPDGLWIPLDRLGSGYRAQIAWMVDFAAKLFERYPDSPDPLAEPAICLIDEIDIHLHPRWQRQIIGYLSERFPRTQFIVTAHSPLIVQGAEEANLVLLRRNEHGVVEIVNDPERIAGWRVDQILASELFGLESTRPPSVEALEQERRELLRRPVRAAAAGARLQEIEAQLMALPGTAEKSGDREAMDIIRAAAAKLRGQP